MASPFRGNGAAVAAVRLDGPASARGPRPRRRASPSLGQIRQIVAPGIGLRAGHDTGDVGIDARRMAGRLRPALLGLGPLLGLLLGSVLPRALTVALAAGTSLKHATLQLCGRRRGNRGAAYQGAAGRGAAPPILSAPEVARRRSSGPARRALRCRPRARQPSERPSFAGRGLVRDPPAPGRTGTARTVLVPDRGRDRPVGGGQDGVRRPPGAAPAADRQPAPGSERRGARERPGRAGARRKHTRGGPSASTASTGSSRRPSTSPACVRAPAPWRASGPSAAAPSASSPPSRRVAEGHA